MVAIVRQDYAKGLPEFKEAMKSKYPGKNIDAAIRNCTDPIWKPVKTVFTVNPTARLFAAQAIALEQAIQSC